MHTAVADTTFCFSAHPQSNRTPHVQMLSPEQRTNWGKIWREEAACTRASLGSRGVLQCILLTVLQNAFSLPLSQRAHNPHHHPPPVLKKEMINQFSQCCEANNQRRG